MGPKRSDIWSFRIWQWVKWWWFAHGFFSSLAQETCFCVLEDVHPQVGPVVGRGNSDICFQSHVMTPKLVVVSFTECHFVIFLRQIKSCSRVFVVVQPDPDNVVSVLEEFNGQILKIFCVYFRNFFLPLAVYPKVVHSLQVYICSLEIDEVWLERIKELSNFCNAVWIRRGQSRQVIRRHNFTFFVMDEVEVACPWIFFSIGSRGTFLCA